MALRIIPLDLKEANAAVAQWHRHHKPAVGHRFSLGAIDNDGKLVGAAIASRPIARKSDQKFILEITRVATDGTRNACSILLGAAAKAAKCMGYSLIQTTTLQRESGSSLKAVGWQSKASDVDGAAWMSRERNVDCAAEFKVKWFKQLNDKPLLQPIPTFSRPRKRKEEQTLFDTLPDQGETHDKD